MFPCTYHWRSLDVCVCARRVFFNAVAALCLILAFFASWMSFGANIKENSREFGVLRALGLNYWQVVRVYIYEAMAVVLSSFTLGTIVGMYRRHEWVVCDDVAAHCASIRRSVGVHLSDTAIQLVHRDAICAGVPAATVLVHFRHVCGGGHCKLAATCSPTGDAGDRTCAAGQAIGVHTVQWNDDILSRARTFQHYVIAIHPPKRQRLHCFSSHAVPSSSSTT